LNILKSALIRADGSNKIGLGHLTRQIDIANELKKLNYTIKFLSKNYVEGIELLKLNHFEVIKLTEKNQTIKNSIEEINKSLSAKKGLYDIIIVDLFNNFDNQKYLNSLKCFCKKIFVLSDEPKQFFIEVDGVFAFSENQETFNYNMLKTKYYTGLKYFPLHSKFQSVPRKNVNKKVTNILLTFGGSDPNNFSSKVTTVLKQIDLNVSIILVLGLGFSKEMHNKVITEKTENIIIKTNIKNMKDHFIETDLCICSAGNTVIEALTCGVPCIVLPQTTLENERAKALEKKELIINLGLNFTHEQLIAEIQRLVSNYGLRKKLSKNAQNSLDGKGIQRIINIIS
jgi:spore coat polysaccharide biosynthesis predicted glycosyltransferase SpsG